MHGGTAGIVDEEFYGRITRFMERHKAPAEVREAVAFLHGLAAWDFAAASHAADGLLTPASRGESWIPVDQLREGAVVAKLRMGDVTGARRYFNALASHSERKLEDLRTRLLDAFLDAAEAGVARRVKGE